MDFMSLKVLERNESSLQVGLNCTRHYATLKRLLKILHYFCDLETSFPYPSLLTLDERKFTAVPKPRSFLIRRPYKSFFISSSEKVSLFLTSRTDHNITLSQSRRFLYSAISEPLENHDVFLEEQPEIFQIIHHQEGWSMLGNEEIQSKRVTEYYIIQSNPTCAVGKTRSRKEKWHR